MTDLINLDATAIAESLAQSLESMAFISVSPAEPPFAAPSNKVLVQIRFSGPLCGALEMMVQEELGALLVANVAGEQSAADVSSADARDALAETMNVVCGALLRGLPGQTQFEISLPTATSVAGDEAWETFTSFDGTVVIDAEGSLVAVRVAPCF